ncbi:MAG TPA: ATP-binding protein [Terriglobales bacterium]|nr:ATP-binding protein [Terriglobales bacterium]
MAVKTKTRPVVGYLVSVIVSLVAIGIVLSIQPLVSFIPVIFVAAVAAIQAYAGLGPAILSIVLCVLGSLIVMGNPQPIDERLHNLTELAIFPIVAAAVVYLMHSRRKHKRRAQEQLLELSTLLDSMPEAVFILNAEGEVVDVNQAGQLLCARSKAELLGAHYDFLVRYMNVKRHADEPSIKPEDTAVARALRGESVQNESRVCEHPRDGSQREMLVSANPMRDTEGQLIGALLVLDDVTEVAELQRQVATTERHFAVGQMATGLAHDFNNVLNTITQASALLQTTGHSPEEQKTYLKMIDNSAHRGAEIISRVREYVRGASNETTDVDVRQLLQDALELTRPLWRNAHNLAVVTEFKPVGAVKANAADLRRVFTNLIVNAIQAMPSGGKLTIACEQQDSTVLASVSDTGVGIPPEQQRKIFAPYYTTKSAGTGLGLSTAQKILLAHGGKITFNSEPGKGSSFSVQLPASTGQPAQQVA